MHTRRRRPLKGGDASVRLYRSSSSSTQRSRSQVSGHGLSERQLGLLTQGLRRTLQKQKYKDMADKINKEHKLKHPDYKYNPKKKS